MICLSLAIAGDLFFVLGYVVGSHPQVMKVPHRFVAACARRNFSNAINGRREFAAVATNKPDVRRDNFRARAAVAANRRRASQQGSGQPWGHRLGVIRPNREILGAGGKPWCEPELHIADVLGANLAAHFSDASDALVIFAGSGEDYQSIRRVTEMCRQVGAEYVGDVQLGLAPGLPPCPKDFPIRTDDAQSMAPGLA